MNRIPIVTVAVFLWLVFLYLLICGCAVCERHPYGCAAVAAVGAESLVLSTRHHDSKPALTRGCPPHGDVELPPGGC